ncbi:MULTISPECIES: alpha/beta hydrolase [Streptomyces]|uniref:Alpha/beta hydrolase n=1 Tax=Streptomyces cinereoruber TaxID=67260 RepID=A0ABX6BGG8_9ACTN|nr:MULTISPECIES: alpha/beta hydrolase [Streptomyces]AVH96762.1 alpha/beta hydrolase [Streptomyces sp. WAC00288]KYG55386.1 proteinase [Streptomyces sp. WAC04657]MBB4161472.1 pimeloyl-ACP methyl ester carboxylesterase [Streptomyces cinereoruber]MBY8818543.1 alpha/beta hydrolase [Streptomyces cinereoruber]NIH60768.1 pimeloyl-ACP methyl ester carboxylesterase [Streptomyces cinereoruber]
MDSRRLLRTTAVALASAGLILSGCSGGSDAAAPRGTAQGRSAPSAAPEALKEFYAQKLKWRDCGVEGFQCATLRAPLDYAKPDGEEIELAVSRVRATGPGKRIGSLLVNPGGPGGSAVGYLQAYAGIGYPAPVRARYDMVAVDPRGVARSEPVECLTGPQMDAYTQVDQTPDDAAETDALSAAFKDFAAGCAKRSGKVLPHVSTVETARDMDVLRAVLGDERLSYVGASYGTFLGATYAELFPDRVGRLVLDGAMDPSLPALDLNRDQTAGFETAFRAFAADCVGRPDCPLGTGSVPAAGEALKKFFRAVDAEPLPTGESRKLGESLATTGVIAAMYDEGAWPQLREALAQAKGGRGAGLLALADSYYEREPDGEYANLMAANAAVNCLDLPAAYRGPADAAKAVPSFEKASPVFGRGLAWAALNCTYWPSPATGRPHRITAEGAAPILVVGTTRDPATPYKWAESLAAQLSSGTLLTYEGDGHTAYGRGSDCVDTAINTYLLEGTPPRDGKRCS